MVDTLIMKGITVNISLTRTLYLDVPENISDDDFLKKAKQEIILPHNALVMASNALRNVNIQIPQLDLKDWDVNNIEYNIIQESESSKNE